MAEKVVLAIDIGSSSIRCSAFINSNIVAASNRNTSSVEAISGKIFVLSPNSGKTLFDLVEDCVDETLAQLQCRNDNIQVVAVGFASFVMNLIGIDVDGNIVGTQATISYACSSDEVANEVDSLKRDLGEEKAFELYQRTGAPLHSAYATPQLRAFYRSNPAHASKVMKWKTVCSLLLDRWTARRDTPISYSEASWCGLLNYTTCKYDDLLMQLLPDGCKAALPELADFDQVPVLNEGISRHTSYWDRWPLLREARLFLGVGDGACANIGSKCTASDRIACTVGTSAAARVCLYNPVGSPVAIEFPSGLFCYRIDRSHVLLGGALNDGGNVIEWLRQLLNMQSNESFDECLKQVSLLMENDLYPNAVITPTLVPFLGGERSTGFRTRATGAMIDLTRDTTAAHIVKSVLEGVTLRLNAIVSRIRQTCRSVEKQKECILVVSGKALEVNQLWRQMLANCLEMKVVFDKDTQEGTSRGAAILIARSIQLNLDSNASAPLRQEVISNAIIEQPTHGMTNYWKLKVSRQEQLISAVSDMYS